MQCFSYLCMYDSLLPKDPLKRAYVRYFIEYYSSKVQSEFFKYAFNIKAENAFTDYEKNVSGALDRVSYTTM